MGRIAVFTLLAAIVGGLLAVSGGAGTNTSGAPAPAAFRLSDGSAGCAFDGSSLACSARDGTTAVLDEDGSSAPSGERVKWGAGTPVLHRASSWWHAGYGCRVEGDAVVCERENGSITVGAGGVGGASSAP